MIINDCNQKDLNQNENFKKILSEFKNYFEISKTLYILDHIKDHDLNIEDHDFGIFCYDLMEHPERYDNKHIRIKGKFIGKDRVQENGFVLGRYAMVCCEQDTSLIGLICISKEYRDQLIPNEWIIVEGDTHTQYDPEYGQNICVMDVTKLEGTKPLSYEYVTFD
jgi:uncharacterized membrane protein YcgQ (UPF0703/DUF1980 family)